MNEVNLLVDKLEYIDIDKKEGDLVSLSVDQSTNKSGYSVCKNGELLVYGAISTTGKKKAPLRIEEVRIIVEYLIDNYNPSVVIMEDVQYQMNVSALISLSKLLGILENLCIQKEVDYEIVHSKTWKSTCGIKGKKRAEQKENTMLFVKEEYGVDASEDVADAISINYHFMKKIEEE